MTKRELRELYFLGREREMWEEKLKKLREGSYVGGGDTDGTPRGNGLGDRTASRAIEEAEIQDRINEKYDEITHKYREIIEYISNVDDSVIRQIIFLKYTCFLTWEEVAIRVGGGNSADSVRMLLNRYLDNN